MLSFPTAGHILVGVKPLVAHAIAAASVRPTRLLRPNIADSCKAAVASLAKHRLCAVLNCLAWNRGKLVEYCGMASALGSSIIVSAATTYLSYYYYSIIII